MDLRLVGAEEMVDSSGLSSWMMMMMMMVIGLVGERVLVSLAMVHWIELVVLEEVELVVLVVQVVLTMLAGLSAYAAELGHESIDWTVLAAPKRASCSQPVHAPVEFSPMI